MDALSLVLPAATIPNPGANSGDTGAFDVHGEPVAADFAALLAAGLLPQQDISGQLPFPEAPAQAPGETAELVAGELSAEAGSLDMAGATLLPHPGVMLQGHGKTEDVAHEARAAATKGKLSLAEANID